MGRCSLPHDRGKNARVWPTAGCNEHWSACGSPGLILRVYPSGRRTYFYQRKRGEPWYKISPAGPITLEAARDKADELFGQLENPEAPRSMFTIATFITDH